MPCFGGVPLEIERTLLPVWVWVSFFQIFWSTSNYPDKPALVLSKALLLFALFCASNIPFGNQ
jgi:hypothetical protein